MLRLLHRGTIKYLSNKTRSAYELLDEIKEALISLGIRNLSYSNNFEEDIKLIFDKFCRKFGVDSQIKGLFHYLFKQFSLRVIDNE